MRPTYALMLLALLAVALLLAAGCTTPSPPATPTPTASPTTSPATYSVMVASNAKYGTILVNESGFTLYYSTRDVPHNGASWCYGTCADNWPPFTASPLTVAPSLNPADFGSITRTDGVKQVTYMGYPLYYFHTDNAPGDTNGYGLLGSWFVINPSGVITMTSTPTPTAPPTTMEMTMATTISPTMTVVTDTPGQPATGGAVTINLIAQNIAFNTSTITVPACSAVTINFDNKDPGTPHNFAVYTNSAAKTPIFMGEIITGPKTIVYKFTAPCTPGDYWFRCDVHPTIMYGTFKVI
jgi:predicted lipoprotein with Yx(FWY)xxD motif/plastocyanin